MDLEYQYSLCYTEKTSYGEFRTYRVADFDSYYRRFNKVEYEGEHSPMRIYRPQSANHIENTAHFIKWKIVDLDSGRHYSYTTPELNHENIYEIYFCPEIDVQSNYSDDEIRRIFKKGITVNDEVSNQFLLAIGFKQQYLTVILLDKKIFSNKTEKYKLSQEINDVINIQHFVNKYSISVGDKISNIGIVDKDNRPVRYPVRYFYKHTYLPETLRSFRLHTVNDYLKVYISRYLKKSKNRYMLTNTNIDIMKIIISDSLEDYELLDQLEHDIGQRSTGLGELIRQNLDDVLEALDIEGNLDVLINNHLLKDNEIKERYLNIIQEEWEKQTILQIEDTEETIKETKEILSVLELEKKNVKKELNNQKNKIKEETKELTLNKEKVINKYDLEISNKTKMLQDIDTQIRANLDDYKYQMMNIAATSGIVSSIENKNSSNEFNNYSGFLKNDSILADESIATSLEEPTEIRDYIYDLESNLLDYFHINQRKDIICTLISAIWMDIKIVTNSTCGFDLAKALSLMIDEHIPLSIYLSESNVDSKKLVDFINESNSSVVYIDGIFDLYNEALLSLLCQNCKEKIIIFGIGNKYILKELSKHLWFYLLYINLENLMDFSTDRMFEKFTFHLKKFKPLVVTVDTNNEFKFLEESGLITRAQGIQLSNMQHYYNSISSEIGFSKLLIEQIYVMNSNKFADKEKLDEIMNANNVSLSKLPNDDMKEWFE